MGWGQHQQPREQSIHEQRWQQRAMLAEQALREIRDQDFRGNRCVCMGVAAKALTKCTAIAHQGDTP